MEIPVRWDNLYLAGVGAYLPDQAQTAEEAIAAGRYSEAANESNGIRAVRLASDDEPGPVMAAAAGRQAVARSGHDKDEFGLVVHACVGHPGRDFWTPAHYVQDQTVGGSGAAVELRQGS